MAPVFPAPKRLSKSTLSMYLRTKCDRELYLSLHKPTDLASAGMPEPLEARAGTAMITAEGRSFEADRNQKLITAFGAHVIFQPDSKGNIGNAPIDHLLSRVKHLPAIVLQPKFQPSTFQAQLLTELGLSASSASLIPQLDGVIPDVIIVRAPESDDEEVLPSGSRRQIDSTNETRVALSIIDIKHTSEANPSYSAEVAMYAVLLANWLKYIAHADDKYFVTVKCFLWTRFKQGQSDFEAALQMTPAPGVVDFYDALIEDSEDTNLRFYLPTVLRFFREDLPRVITTGDASHTGWAQLEWHVDGRCSACDWLGVEAWANAKDKAKIKAQPDHYCMPAADASQHLCLIPGVSRGGRKTLAQHAIGTTSAVASTAPTHAAFQKHSLLKREARKLPLRAQALITNMHSHDAAAQLATLGAYPMLRLSVAVNFDPSSGLLTGLAIQGIATPYAKGVSPLRFSPKQFIVDQKSLGAEWTELHGFLSEMADCFDRAETFVRGHGRPELTAQVEFWSRRQYEELCAAMGRHLGRVFALTAKKQKALAWLFPADELLEHPDHAVSPAIVFLEDIVKRVVFAPTKHVITLFGTAEHYHSGTASPIERDPYYREYLTDGIPRERIYEIWSNAPLIKRGATTVIPRNTAVTRFSQALGRQSWAVSSVADQLRSDYAAGLKTRAPRITLSVPRGASAVAFDAKLWLWWDELQFAVSKAEAKERLALEGEVLEATYDAIRIYNGTPSGISGQYWFDVSASSREAKFEDDEGYLALGDDSQPGFPLDRAKTHIPPGAPMFGGSSGALNLPLYAAVRVTLLTFDRVNLRALVQLETPADSALRPYLEAQGVIRIVGPLFITKSVPGFDWSATGAKILRQIGNPPIAVPEPSTARALGIPAKGAGADAITPAARVLWDAGSAGAQSVITSTQAVAMSQYVHAWHGLNPGQEAAVRCGVEKALTVVWGPPGTGKTKTLAATVHTLVHDANTRGSGLKILVVGPTYKAIEELISRVITAIDQDAGCVADVCVAYSRSSKPNVFSTTSTRIAASSFQIEGSDPGFISCISSIQDTNRVSVVATTVMQAYKFAREIHGGNYLAPVFDVVLIDESSQVPVSRAISALAVLKGDFRLIVAGDHLQMPPIVSLEPPVGAEHMVGSIQTYLFERQFVPHVQPCELVENYRSTQQVVDYARTLGYPSNLTANYPNLALHQLHPLPDPAAGFPASLPWTPNWVDVLDPTKPVIALLHEDDLASQANEFEAKMVSAIVWGLRQTVSAVLDGKGIVGHRQPTAQEFWSDCVGIVTPHRAQRALVVRELQMLFPGEANLISEAVDTVEKFQGGERHAIIVTFGVADTDVIAGEEAFLMQLERTNVAISRAMAKCIVIMPSSLAGHVPQDKRALDNAHAIKGYVDDFCNKEVDLNLTLPGQTRKGKLRYRM